MKLMLTEEIEAIVGCTREDIYKFIQEGMPHFKVGNHFRFVQEEVDEWITNYKPLQERLEEEFVDDKGRTLQEYTTSETILDFFRISQPTMYALCKKGMPYTKVGTKRYFQLEDIIEYFRRGENTADSKEEVVNVDETPTLFVVDGSYHSNKKWGAGIVAKKGKEAKGYTYGGELKNKRGNMYAEYQAMMQTMKIIQKENIKNAVIATDQIHFVNNIQLELLTTAQWMKKESTMIELTKEFQETYIDTRRMCSLRFVYYKKLRSVYTDINETELNYMYFHSHDLSRVYEETTPIVIDLSVEKKDSKIVNFNKKSTTKSTPTLNVVTSNTIAMPNQKDTWYIYFKEKKDGYLYFITQKNNKTQVTKMTHPDIAVALILHAYAMSHSNHKKDVKFVIKNFADFERKIEQFLEKNKNQKGESFKKKFIHLINDERVTLEVPYENFEKEFQNTDKQVCM